MKTPKRKAESKASILRRTRLTKIELEALDYIGNHRKTDVKPKRKSCPISMRTANSLIKKHYAMWIEKSDDIMLTYAGERIYTALHPYSKYRIK